MKINQMHLREFGNIKDKELNFSDGLNVLYGTNEAGKSTVWTALSALLFGMEKKEEEKFRPWNSEYGVSEVTYTLKDGRQFTASKKRRKSFQTEVIEGESGRDVSGDYPQQKGVVLAVEAETGMNREAFLASVMMGQDALVVEGKRSVGLKTRLSRLSTYGDEKTDAARAKKLLERQLDAIGNGTAGSKKKLVAIRNEISALEEALKDAKEAEVRRKAIYRELDSLDEALQKGEKLLALYKKFMDKIAFEDAKRAESRRKEAEALREKLAGKKEVLAGMKDQSGELSAYSEILRGIEQTQKDLPRDEEKILRQREACQSSEQIYQEAGKEAASIEDKRRKDKKNALAFFGLFLVAGIGSIALALLVAPYFWGLTALFGIAAICSLFRLKPQKAEAGNEKDLSQKAEAFRREKSQLEALESILESKQRELSERKDELQKALGAESFREAEAAIIKMRESEETRKKLMAEIEVNEAEWKGYQDAFSEDKAETLLGEAPQWTEADEKEIEADGTTERTVRQKREAVEERHRELTARRAARQTELENLDATAAHPGDLEEELSALSEEEHALSLKKEAIETALTVLDEAQQRIQQDYIPRLNDRMQAWFTKITGEKYRGTFTTAELAPEAEDARFGRVLPEQLSRGTWDQLYLAYRLAAADLLSGEEPLPLVMDEPFAYFDDIRLGRMLEALAELSKERQVILMTCQKREMQELSKMGVSFNEISL